MIKRLWCFIWGHKFVVKAFTGNTFRVVGVLGNESTVSLYRNEVQKYCPRCGCKNKNIDK